MTFDTKLGVDIDPAGFYARLWHLWNPLEYQGSLQDQYIGYAFPMGAFYLLAHLLHIPVWISERLWMSLLVTAGFWGAVRLAEALGIGSKASRLGAGAAFALWPTITILIGSSSGGLLPGLLAPWAVLPFVRAHRGELARWQAAARSGVAIACMGGINAVSTLAALVLPLVYILTRPGNRRRWAQLGWWIPAVIGATAWWAGPLLYQGAYGFNFLPYIEQATTTTATMSAAAALRGTGNWVAYLNLGQPWLTAGSVMTGAAWAALAAAVASAAGLAGIARRDLPEARWLRITLGLAALYGLAGYSGPLGGPLARPVQEFLDGTGAALRNVYKIEPVIAAVLVLGLAHLLGRVTCPAGQERGSVRRLGTGVAAAAVLAGLALPYLSFQVLQPGSFAAIPPYWRQAASWLGSHHGRDTTFVTPADAHGVYTWGQPIDEPLEPLASSPWTQRDLVPYSGGGTADLTSVAEQAIESGQATPGLAAYLDRAGIRYVLVRNDLDPAQPGYTPPSVVHAVLASSGFRRAAAFGTPAPAGPSGQGTSLQAEAVEPSYPPLEIFQASSPSLRASGPARMLPASGTTRVDGGPGSLLQLSGQGLLPPARAAVTEGQSPSLPASQRVVTDGLRRTDTSFGLVNGNTSYTYTATGTVPPDDPQGAGGQPPRQLLPAGAAGHQTTETLSGASSVTASSAGSWLWEQPQANPAYAFDGDPATAWTEARQTPAAADGQWIQVSFNGVRNLRSRAAIRLLDDIPRPVATRLIVTTAAGKATTSTKRTGVSQPLRVPSGPSRWLRITIASVSGGSAGGPGAGISDVSVPGVKVTPYLRPPSPGTAFSFQRQPGSSLGLPGQSPEPSLDREFTTADRGRYTMAGTATPVPGAALNALLSRLDSRTSRVRVTASSTFASLPSLSPRNLLAGTGWVAASPHATLRLSWKGKKPVDEIDLTAMDIGIAAQPTRVLITSPAGTADVPVPADGIVTFPAMKTDRLALGFPSVVKATSDNPVLGTAQQLPVGIGSLAVPALSGLNTGLPAASKKFSLGCGQGPAVTVDGHAYRTSVSGTAGDLLKLTPLPVRVCSGPLTLGAGEHTLSSAGTGTALAVSGLSVTRSPASSPASSPAARSLRIGTWQDETRTATVGPGARSYLEVHQTASTGWTATLNGMPLTPVTLDGWQQAFVVPKGAGGTVTMSFTPVSGYRDVLIGSVAAAAVVLAAACWRRRYGLSRPGSGWDPEPGTAGHVAAIAAATALVALVGGPVAVAVPLAAALGWWRRDWVPPAAFAAMAASGIAVLTGLGHGPSPGDGPFGWPAQAAALIALAAALTPAAPDTVMRALDARRRRP